MTLNTDLLMAESINVTPSSTEGMGDLSVSQQQATATGENNLQPQQKEKSQPTSDTLIVEKPCTRNMVEWERENLIYKEDLAFVPIITELYENIPRSYIIFNRWCLVYYTGQPYSKMKPKNQTDRQEEHSDSDREESMSRSETGANSQIGNSDDKSSASFKTVEEKNVGFSSKRNRQEETDKPCHKKRDKKKMVWVLK